MFALAKSPATRIRVVPIVAFLVITVLLWLPQCNFSGLIVGRRFWTEPIAEIAFLGVQVAAVGVAVYYGENERLSD